MGGRQRVNGCLENCTEHVGLRVTQTPVLRQSAEDRHRGPTAAARLADHAKSLQGLARPAVGQQARETAGGSDRPGVSPNPTTASEHREKRRRESTWARRRGTPYDSDDSGLPLSLAAEPRVRREREPRIGIRRGGDGRALKKSVPGFAEPPRTVVFC